MGYEIKNNINEGYFSLIKAYRGDNPKYPINYYLDKFNIDLNDYWILKKSGRFRLLDIEDIEKYSGIMCFKKNMYNKQEIDKWLNFLLNKRIPYLNNPFPPIEIYNKIKIIEWDIV